MSKLLACKMYASASRCGLPFVFDFRITTADAMKFVAAAVSLSRNTAVVLAIIILGCQFLAQGMLKGVLEYLPHQFLIKIYDFVRFPTCRSLL